MKTKTMFTAALIALTMTPTFLPATASMVGHKPVVPVTIRHQDSIDWITEPGAVNEALHDAVQQHKPVMIVLHADWCPWCTKMDQETFSDDKVVRLAAQYVCIKIDTTTDFGKKVQAQLGVDGIPYVLFHNAAGKNKAVHGYESADAFAADMQEALN